MPVHCHFNDAKTNEFVPLRLVNLELRGCLDPRAKTEGKDAESDELDLLLWVGIAYVMRKERLIETEGKSEEKLPPWPQTKFLVFLAGRNTKFIEERYSHIL